jgi:hypothetical protein
MSPRTAIVLFALAVSAGCSKSPHDVAPVRGTVTIDGKPLAVGRVMFAPASKGDGLNAGKPALGPIQSDGSYVLGTYGEDDGAVVGEHTITILGPRKKSPLATPVSVLPSGPKFDRLTVPRRFTVVAGQENQIDIALTSQDVARFGVQDD